MSSNFQLNAVGRAQGKRGLSDYPISLENHPVGLHIQSNLTKPHSIAVETFNCCLQNMSGFCTVPMIINCLAKATIPDPLILFQ